MISPAAAGLIWKAMKKPNRTTLLFILIFLVGVLGFVAYINRSIEKVHTIEMRRG